MRISRRGIRRPPLAGIVLSLALLLAACGGADSAEEAPAEPTQAPTGETEAPAETEPAETATETEEPAEAMEPMELRLAHGVNETHPYHIASEYLAERLPELTDGNLTVTIFPGAQLGDEAAMLDLYATGDLDLGIHIAAVGGQVVPELAFLGIPFLWDDLAHWERVMLSDETYDYWQGLIEENGAAFRLAAVGTAGDRITMSREPLGYQSLDDLAGKKFRIPESPLLANIHRALGIEPVILPYPDTFAALQSGLIDAVGTSPAGAISIDLQEVVRHVYFDNSETSIILMLLRADLYDSLPDAYREALDQALDEVQEVWLEAARDADQEVLDTVFTDAGIEFHDVPTDVRQEMIAIVQPIQQEEAENLGVTEFLEIIESARE